MEQATPIVNEPILSIDNGPKVKKKTRTNKAKEILKIALKDCTEFSLRIAESPNGVVIVAFVAHLSGEHKEELSGFSK